MNVPGRSCPVDTPETLGDSSRIFHIVGYFSILLMFVGAFLFRRNVRKRGSFFSAKSPQQPYTSLDQQNDEWDNWEDEGPRMESGMFVAYRLAAQISRLVNSLGVYLLKVKVYCELDFQSLAMNPYVHNHSFARPPIIYNVENNDRKTTSSGLQMIIKPHSRGSSSSKVGGLGETEVNYSSSGTSKSQSGQDDTYIKHPVSDDLFSELGALVVRMEGCVLSLVCPVYACIPNSMQCCSSPSCGVFSLRVAQLIKSMMCIFFAGIQAKPTFNKHTTRVVHTVGRWEPDSELQEPSGWDEDSLDI